MGNPGAYAERHADLDGHGRHVRECRTVVVDVGEPGAPQYALTQAQTFLVDAAGRAVPDAVDPCDPARALRGAAADGPGTDRRSDRQRPPRHAERARRRQDDRPARHRPSIAGASPSSTGSASASGDHPLARAAGDAPAPPRRCADGDAALAR